MANGHGGYREPTNPAPVSGPGRLAQRTDGAMHAPVPGSAPSGNGEALAAMGPDLSQITPFGAPSARPSEPITAGMPGGDGAGPNMQPAPPMSAETAERLRSYLPVFIMLASSPDADPATKQYVRQLRGELG